MLRSYLRLCLFAVGLLVGVQLPGFMADYQQRVDARWLEAEQSLSGFRVTAKRFFKGDLQALVAHYRVSDDPVMRSDSLSVAQLVERAALLARERTAMQQPWYGQAWHLLTQANHELRQETFAAYRYQVLLAPEAIAWGLSCALLLACLVELLLVSLALMMGFGRKPAMQQRYRH